MNKLNRMNSKNLSSFNLTLGTETKSRKPQKNSVKAKVKIVGILLYCVLDTVLSTAFYFKEDVNDIKDVSQKMAFNQTVPVEEISANDFTSTLLDYWLLSLIRVAIVLGSLLSIRFSPIMGPVRIRKYTTLFRWFDILQCMWAVIKMLIYTEGRDVSHDSPFWGLFITSVIASFVVYVVWLTLASFVYHMGDQSTGGVTNTAKNINLEGDDSRPLLDDQVSISIDGEDEDDDEDENAEGEEEDDDTENKEEEEEDDDEAVAKKMNFSEKRSTLIRLIKRARPDLLYIVLSISMLVATNIVGSFLPYYSGRMIDAVALEGDVTEFYNILKILVSLDITTAFFATLHGLAFQYALSRYSIRMRNLLFEKIMKQSMNFFDDKGTGAITSRLTADVTTMTDNIAMNFDSLLEKVFHIGVYTIFMTYLSWRLSMVTFLTLPILASLTSEYGAFYQKLQERVQDTLAKANEVASEAIHSIATVRSFAGEQTEIGRYENRLHEVFKLMIKEAFAYAAFIGMYTLFNMGSMVVTFFYGGHLILGGFMDAGNMIAFLIYQMDVTNAFGELSDVYTGFMVAIGASKKVLQYIEQDPEVSIEEGHVIPDFLAGKMELKNVSFSYASRPNKPVLKNISFTAQPGEVVALVGPSGGGKSSCMKLLQNFYQPSSGKVLLDGRPINSYQHKYLHSNVAIVNQEPALFARSIKENIAYGIDDIKLSDVQCAAKMADADSFICRMKKKYDSDVGEGGKSLSGGQKQRIAIARALVREPSVLLLDEATSALDSETEHSIQQALSNNFKGKTVISIAHRLSTVQDADRILVIENGKIVEEGSHVQLCNIPEGRYRGMVDRQTLATVKEAGEDGDDDMELVWDDNEEEEELNEDDSPYPEFWTASSPRSRSNSKHDKSAGTKRRRVKKTKDYGSISMEAHGSDDGHDV